MDFLKNVAFTAVFSGYVAWLNAHPFVCLAIAFVMANIVVAVVFNSESSAKNRGVERS